MRSKRFTASVTATRKADRIAIVMVRAIRRELVSDLFASRLARRVLLGNLAVVIFIAVAFSALGEMRKELLQAKIESLRAAGTIIANALGQGATGSDAVSRLDRVFARQFVRVLAGGEEMKETRVRVLDARGQPVADSAAFLARVDIEAVGPPDRGAWKWSRVHDTEPLTDEDIQATLSGRSISGERMRDGERVVVVTFPIRRVAAVVGVLVMETGGVDETVWAERRQLLPLIGIALVGITVWSIFITFTIVRPIRTLSLAAERVRREGPQRAKIDILGHERDEIGDLSRSLAAMNDDLAERMAATEAFAADVAHEIKNPLASLRSSLDTLPIARTAEQKETLLKVMAHDVRRIDRLVTDISAASRLDAEIGNHEREPVDLRALIQGIIEHYQAITPNSGHRFLSTLPKDDVYVSGVPEKLGQVLRNLIDNAVTFSPEQGKIHVDLSISGADCVVHVTDEGPGLPDEVLERVFERFYTQRPKGSDFGSHSGLGLAICRQIISAHRGTISANNRKDRAGAQFTIILPRDGD
jgi:two-component system, OmpR family, sensor histidine kinase ChvG